MALRVLLADESSTIKRVMQLALQDFDVEVKAVPIGLDVHQVALSFLPDIIFVDVLLSKKNGYEVSAELKDDNTLAKIPIVLMWSGFMDLDQAKVAASRVDRKLEKPFDAETLRSMVKELVPRTQSNIISNYLSFPNLPSIEEMKAELKPPTPTPTPQAPTPPPPSKKAAPPPESESMDMDEAEEFKQVPLNKDAWAQAPLNKTGNDLSRFKINVNEEELSKEYEKASMDLSSSSIAMTGSGLEEIPLEQFEKPMAKVAGSGAIIDPMRAEQVLRDQVREVLENIAWKIIPEIAEKIVREEIQKLMKDSEKI